MRSLKRILLILGVLALSVAILLLLAVLMVKAPLLVFVILIGAFLYSLWHISNDFID